jgi:putative spermidine/putrescine transport system permease protein
MDNPMVSVARFGFLAIVLAYTLSPLVAIFLVSLSTGQAQDIVGQTATFLWYREAITNSTIQQAFLTSIFVALIVAAASVALGFASVRLVRKLPPALALICIILISIPALVPAFVSGFSLHVYYQLIGLDGTLLGIILTHFIFTCRVFSPLCHAQEPQL